MATKRQQTMAKRDREFAVLEKRTKKRLRKEAARAEQTDEPTTPEPYVPDADSVRDAQGRVIPVEFNPKL
ncbi:MAG TPA: hypothetical protein VMU58_08250 [Gaiellaceae bacterium]|nr:hypothetical protein [Gaiellaceae bacterium]